MPDWKSFTGTIPPINTGPFSLGAKSDFSVITKQKLSYNEGDHIATYENPVWTNPEGSTPITDTHIPCGYWTKEYVPFTLPIWKELRPFGDTNHNWWRACCSNDTQIIYASVLGMPGENGSYLQRSVNGGASWLQDINAGIYSAYAVACSANGLKAIAANGNFYILGGKAYYTSNAGNTWNSFTGGQYLYRSAIDEDGINAGIVSARIAQYINNPGFVTTDWWSSSSKNYYTCASISISHDGSIIVAGSGAYIEHIGYPHSGNLYSNISGVISPQGLADYQCVAMDANCNTLITTVYGGRIWKSTNRGVSWKELLPTENSENKNWRSLAVSYNGKHILVGVCGGPIYYSGNGGLWFVNISLLSANDIQFNKNGTAAMVATSTRLYILTGFN